MPEFLTGDVHEITTKLAYQLWEQRDVRLTHLKWIGLRPKGLWRLHSEIGHWGCPWYGITLEPNEGAHR